MVVGGGGMGGGWVGWRMCQPAVQPSSPLHDRVHGVVQDLHTQVTKKYANTTGVRGSKAAIGGDSRRATGYTFQGEAQTVMPFVWPRVLLQALHVPRRSGPKGSRCPRQSAHSTAPQGHTHTHAQKHDVVESTTAASDWEGGGGRAG